MALVAGIDSSTQSCKVLVVEAGTGRVVRSGRAPHPEGTEVDPQVWWEALLAAVADAGGLADVEAISVAGQQHGLVALDAEGAVIRDALLWNDTRSAEAALALRAEFGDAELARRTGSVPVASFTSTKLRWLRDAEPERAARVAAVALPHDWLTWRLRGFGAVGSERGPALGELTTDRSDASGTGYFSPTEDRYDLGLLAAALGHDGVVLPRVLGPSEAAGTTAAAPGIPAGVPVAAGAGDNAAAALGLGAREGDVVLSIGTSGTVFAVTATPVADASGAVAGFADASGGFLPLVATLNAARVLGTAAGLLGVGLDELADLALAAEPGAGGVVLTPYFAGERTPNLPHARASYSGLSLENATRENLARASVEGMLCGLADGLDAVRRQGVSVARVLLIGGGAASAAVPSVAAEVFGLPITVPAPGEYVALGAAAQAAGLLAVAPVRWEPAELASRAAAGRPEIRAAYARAAAAAAEEA
ncbi:xylulokinase [Galactobacter valiniphilus]|uniref:xylulokinase n=1 Tax=Galactobacter valiniphilus TaxID=2676122 RepID=UPI003736ED3B